MIHILVLEDDINLNQIVCTYLNDSGFQAKGCLSANEAYEEMYNNLYELIISDIMMPEIDDYMVKPIELDELPETKSAAHTKKLCISWQKPLTVWRMGIFLCMFLPFIRRINGIIWMS